MNSKKKRNALLITFGVLILGLILNFLFELMPDNFKQTLSDFASEHLGLSYFMFWIICTTIVIFTTLFFVWRQALSVTGGTDEENKKNKNHSINRIVSLFGKKSIYIKKNKGDIHIK